MISKKGTTSFSCLDPPVSTQVPRRLCRFLGTVSRPSRETYSGRLRITKRGIRRALGDNGSDVELTVEKASRNCRRLYAGVSIAAPVQSVWGALTSYDSLAEFIPGLAENKCLQKRPEGATLMQVGEQDVAFGAKFKATVVLDIQEYQKGIPAALCFQPGRSQQVELGNGKVLFPEPRSQFLQTPSQDISFNLVRGDFMAFRGIWRMQSLERDHTLLSYSLHVQPHPWLPVRLIQSRIEGEVKMNLRAIRDHSERCWGAKQI